MVRCLTRQTFLFLLIIVSFGIDVYFLWKSWPKANSKAYLLGGGNCTSEWDCNFHGECLDVEEPMTDTAQRVGSVSIWRTKNAARHVGHCECDIQYTGSHCSVHIILFDISLRFQDEEKVLMRKSTIEKKRGPTLFSKRSGRNSGQSGLRKAKNSIPSWMTTLICLTLGLLMYATGFGARHADNSVMWILFPVLLMKWNSVLLNVPNQFITEAELHGRVNAL